MGTTEVKSLPSLTIHSALCSLSTWPCCFEFFQKEPTHEIVMYSILNEFIEGLWRNWRIPTGYAMIACCGFFLKELKMKGSGTKWTQCRVNYERLQGFHFCCSHWVLWWVFLNKLTMDLLSKCPLAPSACWPHCFIWLYPWIFPLLLLVKPSLYLMLAPLAPLIIRTFLPPPGFYLVCVDYCCGLGTKL